MVSRSLLILFVGFSFFATAQVKWMSFDEALTAQKTSPRNIIVDVYTTWCGPCKMLDKNTFGNAEVSAFINENFYPVKFNAEGNSKVNFNGNVFENPKYDPSRQGRNARHQFTAYLGITGYPTVAFFDENANYLAPIVGYQNVQQMEFYLKLFVSGDYKKFTSQQDFTNYFKNFKAQFKG
ncbi:MAG: thioredoxin family protein [Flavobacteriaceae bacterium]|jgi:thioredoxin-related protein|nr:thioredoxin family protein [Flavobacteriaceae bacterium]